MKYQLGTTVRITEDCREEFIGNLTSKTGEFGVYVGDVPMVMFGEISYDMPKIVFEDGDVLYGCECWWEPVEDISDLLPLTEAQQRLSAYKKVVLDMLEQAND